MNQQQQPLESTSSLNARLDVNVALQAAGLGVWELDPITQLLNWDDRCRELFGIARNSPLSYEQAVQHIHPEDVNCVQEAVQSAMNPESGGNYDVTYRTIGADDGKLRWVRFIGKGYFTEAGEVYRFAGVAQEVSQQLLAQRKIEASEAQLRSLVESAPFPIGVYIGPQMEIQFVNQSIIDVWGKGPDIVGRRYADVLPELANQGVYEQLNRVYTTGVPYHANNQRVDLFVDGQLRPYYFKYSFTPLHNADGQVYGLMNTAAEVTDLVLTRQQLEESQERYRSLASELEKLVQQRTEELETSNEELAATNEELSTTNEDLAESNRLLSRMNLNLEQFAYIASHDMQEPLRKIQQFSDIIKSSYEPQLGDGVKYLERIQAAASRLSTLIRDVLSYSRISSQQDTTTAVLLNQVIDLVKTDLELLIEETGAVVDVDDLPTIWGDALQLGQLFLNLISNSLKFRQTGRKPHIQIRYQTLAASALPATVQPTRTAATYHRIEVADNGIGFDVQYAGRIFQVFQRLHGKSEYAGTGIGLSICQKVVENHGGAITAHSKPGQGATFTIYLPL